MPANRGFGLEDDFWKRGDASFSNPPVQAFGERRGAEIEASTYSTSSPACVSFTIGRRSTSSSSTGG
jgi:hypothetical protein